MKIAVSACLLGHNCKYNGSNNRNDALLKALTDHDIIPVCPEQLGGLPTPRASCEIVRGEVINTEGQSCDREYRLGAQKALQIIREKGAQAAILQSRSPSCGAETIYDGSFSRTLIPGQGVFAALLKENGIEAIDVENTARWKELLKQRWHMEEISAASPEITTLITYSQDWEKEENCYGYRANTPDDFVNQRIFILKEDETILGYLFGHNFLAQNMNSIVKDGTPCFEVEELYIIPQRRKRGLGKWLFDEVCQIVRNDCDTILLSTANKNYKAIMHFYLEEAEMEFWSARLYKRLD